LKKIEKKIKKKNHELICDTSTNIVSDVLTKITKLQHIFKNKDQIETKKQI